MREPQRNWMLENNGEWNVSAVGLDHMLGRYCLEDWHDIGEYLNRNEQMRRCFIAIHEEHERRFEKLYRELRKCEMSKRDKVKN